MIFADNAGWDDEAKYAFNDAATLYVEEYERLRDATKIVRVPKPRGSRSTYEKEVPANTIDTLFKFLGINPDDVKAAQEAKRVMKLEITDDMWAQMESGEWLDAEPE